MRTHNIPSYENGKDIPIIPSDLALLSILTGSNYPCLELIFMVPKVFEPLKFDCIQIISYLCLHFKVPRYTIELLMRNSNHHTS